MADASTRGRNNRRRGQSGEREVCAALSAAFGLDVRRVLGQERDSGTDVRVPGFNIEVKRRTAIAGLYDWLAVADVGTGIPIACMRADGREWLVAMRLSDWIALAAPIVAGMALQSAAREMTDSPAVDSGQSAAAI